MQGHIILPDNDKRKILELNFEMYTGISLSPYGTADQLINWLGNTENEASKISLIICQSNIEDENTALKIFYYLKSNKLDVPLVCFGPAPKIASEPNVYIHEQGSKFELRPIIQWVAKKAGITSEMMAQKEVENFYAIKTTHFFYLETAPVDIYLKDKDEYKKVYCAGETVPENYFKELFFQKIDFLYIDKLERLFFVNYLSDKLLEIMASKDEDLGQFITIQEAELLFTQLKSYLLEIGLDEKSYRYIIGTKNAVKSIITSCDTLIDLISLLNENKSGYLFRHSLLTSMLAHHLDTIMNKSSKKNLEAICFACYFHDITLLNDDWASIQTEEELKDANLTHEQEKSIREHALRSAKLLEKVEGIPPGTVELVKQHHGKQNGIGLPDGASQQVSELSIIFQIAERYIHIFLQNEEAFDPKKALIEIGCLYDSEPYKKVINALQEYARLPSK